MNSDIPMSSRRIHWPNVLTVGGAGILVGTEVTALTWAAGWALGGLAGLPPLLATLMEIVGAGIGLAASYSFVRAALNVEPIFPTEDADEPSACIGDQSSRPVDAVDKQDR